MHWLQKLVMLWLHIVLQTVALLTEPLFRWLYEGCGKKLSPPADQLLQKSAVELAHLIRTKQVTSERVVRAFVDRIKEVNPILNAVIADRFDEALQEAREFDVLIQQDNLPESLSEENAPLLGIPFTAKEAFGIVGLPNTSGLIGRKNVVARKDADVVAKLRKAGAIPIGLTNCSELCMWYESSNLIYGRSNNPYHQGRTVGGSSGGEGCILSAAGSVIGCGSDIGGSIRMPAYFNGIFGHKPTTGIVSNEGQFPAPTSRQTMEFLSTGPMCRFACDLEPMFKVMLGPENIAKLKLDQKVDLRRVKFHYMEDDGGSFLVSRVDKQIKNAVCLAATHFEGTVGAQVERVQLLKLRHSLMVWASRMGSTGNESFCRLMGNREKEVRPLFELARWFFPQSRRHTMPAIMLGLGEKLKSPPSVDAQLTELSEKMKAEFQDLLGDNGVFLYPTHPVPAPYHNQPLVLTFNFCYTAIFNVLGLPVTQVPMGMSKEGVPIGIQVVGSKFNDHLTLAVARELENAFGGWVPPF